MNSKISSKLFFTAVVGLFMAFSVTAQTTNIYDNTSADQGSNLILTNGQSIGVEILPAALSSYPYLWSFSYELYGANANHPTNFSGTVQGDVSFYYNNGVGGSPGTAFYNSGWFSLSMPLAANGVGIVGFAWPDIYSSPLPGALNMPTTQTLPSDFTVVFSFSGLDAAGGDVLGLANFQPQTLGTNYGDYWSWNGSSWNAIYVSNNVPAATSVGMQLVGSAQTTGLPNLTLTHNGNIVTLSWSVTGSYTLQQSSNLANSSGWIASPLTVTTANGTSSVTITSPTGNLFFRLANP